MVWQISFEACFCRHSKKYYDPSSCLFFLDLPRYAFAGRRRFMGRHYHFDHHHRQSRPVDSRPLLNGNRNQRTLSRPFFQAILLIHCLHFIFEVLKSQRKTKNHGNELLAVPHSSKSPFRPNSSCRTNNLPHVFQNNVVVVVLVFLKLLWFCPFTTNFNQWPIRNELKKWL